MSRQLSGIGEKGLRLRKIKYMLNKLLDFLYPRCCPVCHRILKDQNGLICPECEKKLTPVLGPRCFKCGKPVEKDREFCEDCGKTRRFFDEGRGIFPYDEKMKYSLMKYKYFGCREYGDFYARAMSLFGRKEIVRWQPDLIVPVPLHWKKQRMRGFNQAAYLALGISRCTGITTDTALVVKTHKTKSQKKLNARERQLNLREAFQVTKRVDGRIILVIDDVYTTGSTMDAMAHCLKEAGAEKVYFLTLCIGKI